MAEKFAHLTLTSSPKPSIFEFIAQSALNDVLQPALKKVIDVIYFKYNRFEPIWIWFDEIFFAANSLLQLYYLNNHCGSFSENFYGLKRCSVADLANLRLNNREIALSIATLTVLPYFLHKLSKKADELYFVEVSKRDQRWKDMIIKTSSAFNISLQIMKFMQHLRYLSGSSDFNCPLLWLAGVKLVYAENEESNQFRNMLPILLQRSLELSAFFLQFYQWWQNDKAYGFGNLPNPPAPDVMKYDEQPVGICPLCRKRRHISTVLTVSGFIYCFSCINSYTQKYQRCPVTSIPATFQDLIRIYPPGT